MRETPARTRALRADAQRNVTAILDAAQACLARESDASMGDIARAAGVGRVTLYGHFPSRADLIDAVFARTLTEADQALEQVDLTGDPRGALARLVASSWQIVNRFHALLHAAQRALGPTRIRDHHEQPLRRVEALLARGREEGVFRTDLPNSWLVATFYSVLHSAADEITAGRLQPADTGRIITATLLAAFTPPGERVLDAATPELQRESGA